MLLYRLNDVSSSLAQQNTKRDEFLHSRDLMQREKEHEANTERLKLQNKMAEMVEEVSRKILAKEMKLREEAQEKYLQLEKVGGRMNGPIYMYTFTIQT